MDQTRPQNGSDYTSEQNRVPRKHRKRRAIEKPNKHRTDQVEDRCNDQCVPMKGRNLLRGHSCGKDPADKRLDRIPDTVAA